MKTFCFLVLFLPIIAASQPTSLQNKAHVLKRFLDLHHYQPVTWNDSTSVLLYNKWIKNLDNEKLFFTTKDIDILSAFRNKLDGEIAGKEWKFFSISTSLLHARAKKVDSMVNLILSRPTDVSKPDQITWPFKDFANSDQDLFLRWQKYLKWRILADISDIIISKDSILPGQPPSDFNSLDENARLKRKKHEEEYISDMADPVSNVSMENKYLNCIAWCYDPHTEYFSLSLKKEWDAETSGSEYSSGFTIEKNEKGDKTIGYLQPGGSAWRSGMLHTGDVLLKIKVKGKEKEVGDFSEMELKQQLSGTDDIEITVRSAAGEIKSVKLVKEMVRNDESIVKSYVIHGTKNFGYINLPGFYSRESGVQGDTYPEYNGCANDVSKEIIKLKKDTIAGLILDLRFNGGGSMWEAMQLAGIFIDFGPVASVKDKDGKVHFLKDPNRGTIYDGPMIVLINGASASASEFVSAALQDYNRALIVGGETYGKGSAQVIMPMDTNSISPGKKYEEFVKVTDEKFYRVNGSTTQWKGVVPDIALPDVYADVYKEKYNESALQPDISKEGMYQALASIPVQPLNSKSKQRVETNPYFKSAIKLQDWISHYYKGRTIQLQWAGYTANYKQTMNIFKGMKEDGKLISVTNNSYDKQKVSLSSGVTQEINNTYLKKIEGDGVISEACNIFRDWVK